MKQSILLLLLCLSSYVHATGVLPEGTYRMAPKQADNLSVFIKNADFNELLYLWTETNVSAQRWILSNIEGDVYKLTNAYSGKALVRRRTNIRQEVYANNTSDWEIVPVEGMEGYYYITGIESDKGYLKAPSAANGTSLNVSFSEREGDISEDCIWKLELTSNLTTLTPLSSEIREEMMQSWRNKYIRTTTSGYRIGSGGWWGDAEMIEMVLDAYETTGSAVHADLFRGLYNDFTRRNGTNWLGNGFNDDITWMVLASVRAYLMFGDEYYLTYAKANFDGMYQRALQPMGTLRWLQSSEHWNGTNSCINGPAQVAACYLAIATKDDSYNTKAKNLYALQRQHLYNPSNGHVYDSFTWNGNTPTNYNHWGSTYNQGTFLGAAVMLYNRYGDQQYQDDARMIMRYVVNDLCNGNGIIHVCQVATGDLSGFKGILMRYARRFIVDMKETDYVSWMQKNALHAYNNRNSAGISSSAWLTKAPENFVFDNCTKDCSFNTDAFGPSTAVSAVFNAPLDENRIVKDGFSKIEAEHFDYLKGVYATQGTDDESSVVGNYGNGRYTAYSNVDFGDKQAKSVEVRISKTSSRFSRIEIRVDSLSGVKVGEIETPMDGDGWHSVFCNLSQPLTGMKKLYFVFQGVSVDSYMKLNYFKFSTNEHSNIQDLLSGQPNVKIYPNPVVETLCVDMPDKGQIQIYTASGQLVLKQDLAAGLSRIQMSHCEKAIYIVKLLSEGNTTIHKIIKE